MTKIQLTDNQRAVLSAAARSANLVAWPLPKRLKLSAGSTAIVVRGLLQKGLIEQRRALGTDPVWKEDNGKSLTLVISRAGLAACGIIAADETAQVGTGAANKTAAAGISDGVPRMPRSGSKLATLVELLGRKEGATIEQMAEATGWLSHSVRGVLSAVLAKKFGIEIVSEKVEGRDRTYRTRNRPGE
jgi:hypothetical protein